VKGARAAARRLDALLFDVDGTLADSLPLCYEAIRAALRPYRRGALGDVEIHAMFGPSEEGIVRARVPRDEGDSAYARFLAVYHTSHDRTVGRFDGIVPMLRALVSAGIRLGVVTGKGADTARYTLERLELLPFFKTVRAGTQRAGRKMENLRAIRRKWAVPSSRIAYLGDAASDMAFAREARVRALGAAWSVRTDSSSLARAGAEEVFGSPNALIEWVLPSVPSSTHGGREGRPPSS
jgi:phosphoglycolate phosphatase-like HAD superfamily hydrolase